MEANRLIFGPVLAIGFLSPSAPADNCARTSYVVASPAISRIEHVAASDAPALAHPMRTQAQLERETHVTAVKAMNLLGIMFAKGEGVSKNRQIAVKLFRESAMQGYTPAMANLGTLYERDSAGRPDLHRAYAWLRAAIFFGVPEEFRDSTVLRLGMIAERLGPHKIIAAERLASKIAARVIEACGCAPTEETELTSISTT